MEFDFEQKQIATAEIRRSHEAKIRSLEMDLADELSPYLRDLENMREEMKNLREEITPDRIDDAAKFYPLRNGWLSWNKNLAKLNSLRLARSWKFAEFITAEMAHFNTAYHNGQICRLP